VIPGPPERALVLVVDDDDLIRRVVRTVLETDGHEVAEAADGAGALAVVAERGPRLVILDLLLPGMDGIEVCRQLDHGGAKVVVLTARDDPSLEATCRDAGADAFLVKPFASDRLLSLVGELLAVP
jgi:CheY-like chemotaxis protein